MKRLSLTLAIVAAMASASVLGGCETVPGTSAAQTVQLDASKAAYSAEVAYSVILRAIDSHVVTGAKARALKKQADATLTKVRAAAAIGDGAAVKALTAALADLAAPYQPAAK